MKLNAKLFKGCHLLALLILLTVVSIYGYECVGCSSLRANLTGPGLIEGLQEDASKSEGSSRVYKVVPGERYTVRLKNTSCEGSTFSNLSCCGQTLFTREPGDRYWLINSNVSLSASNPNACPKDPVPDCECEDCTKSGGCRCACYQEAKPGETTVTQVVCEYKAWKLETVNIDTRVPNFNAEQAIADAAEEGWQFIGILDPSAPIWKAKFKNASEEALTTRSWDQDASPAPSTDEPDCFVAWGKNTREKTVTGPDTAEVPCPCGQGGTSGPADPQDTEKTIQLIVWRPYESQRNDPGSGSSSGPSDYSPGGDEGSDSLDIPVASEIQFGLGRDEEGGSKALLRFAGELDSADPLAPENFRLLQPFTDEGAGPVTVSYPGGSVVRRYNAHEVVIDEYRPDGDTVLLQFTAPASGQLMASHLLTRINETNSSLPGLHYTVTRNGQTQKTEYYGKKSVSGGRIWRQVESDGSTTEGLDTPVDPVTKKRMVQRGKGKTVEGVYQQVEETIETYQLFSFGERLVERVQRHPGQADMITEYAYCNTTEGKAAGMLKWRIEPDGSWVRNEYKPLDGELSRVFRPWLDLPSHPSQATLQNSHATTYQQLTTGESWEIETILGVVTSRQFVKKRFNQSDPLIAETDYSWRVPLWKLSLPEFMHQSGNAHPTRLFEIEPTSYGLSSLAIRWGTISQALSTFYKQEVLYVNAPEKHWTVRSKKRPPACKVYELVNQVDAQPATLNIQCSEAQTALSGALSITVTPNPSSGEGSLVIGPFTPSVLGSAEEMASALAGFLYPATSGALLVSYSSGSSTVTVQTLAAGGNQSVVVNDTTGAYSSGAATGSNSSSDRILLGTFAWFADSQDWVRTIPASLPNQVPASRQVAMSLSSNSAQRVLVADHGGRLDLTLAAVTGLPSSYASVTHSLRQSHLLSPPSVYIWERLLDPGEPPRPGVPAVPATRASLTVECSSVAVDDIDSGGIMIMSSPSYLPNEFCWNYNYGYTPEDIAQNLANAIQLAMGTSVSVSVSGSSVTITTWMDGSSANLITESWGRAFSLSQRNAAGTDMIPEIPPYLGVPPFYYWAITSSSGWSWAGPSDAPLPESPLGSLHLFNGTFDTTMTQRYTADYAFWDGRLEMRNAGATEGVTGDLRRVVDFTGRVTMYSYDRGIFNALDNSFDWTQTGQAIKTTQRTYAADPASFQLLEIDPVKTVSMSDYQGQMRVAQIWKGEDMVVETTHDYNVDTRDRLWMKEGAVKTYEAVRDTNANNLTETDSSGMQTRTQFTTDGEVEHTAKLGHGGRPDITSATNESDDGLTTTNTTTAGGLQHRTSSTRDSLGRIVSVTDENGFTTSYSYPSSRKTVETRPDGSTRITENHLDGRLKTVTGTGVIAEYHTYEVDEAGNLTETVYLNDDGTGNTRSPRWRSSTTNGIGWLIAESQPAPPSDGAANAARGVLTSRHFYNTKGQRIRTERPSQPALLYGYDVFGRQSVHGIDVNNNGSLQVTGSEKEPTTTTTTNYEKVGAVWYEKTITSETASSSTQPRTRTTLRLLGGSLHDVIIEYTSDGLAATSVTSRNPVTRTVTSTTATNQTASGQVTTRTLVNGLLLSETRPGATGVLAYDYDALERPTLVTGLDGVQRRTLYFDGTDADSNTPDLARSLVWKEEMQNITDNAFVTQCTYAYHSTPQQPGYGRLSSVTQADSTTLTYEYDLLGHQVFVGGSGTYPVRYQYNDFGELWKMHTFRSGTPTATSTGDVTTWDRDQATGVLLSKIDASNNSVTTSYDPTTGRLSKRTLARKGPGNADISITYNYDGAGRLEHINYSDGTPDVTHTYHADGQLKTTLDAAGLHTYQYEGPGGQLSGETITGDGILAGSSWSTKFVTETNVNGQNLRDVYSWSWGSSVMGSIDYDYDHAGRLWKVKAFGHTATYGYHPTIGRKETLNYGGAGLTGRWVHDTKGRLESIGWTVGNSTLSRHVYGFDDLHRRSSVERENGETWRYEYNDRGEVESAAKKAGNTIAAEPKRGLQSGYSYDLIGNRIMDKQHTPGSGSNLSEAVWMPNALNQIVEREHHESRWIFGHANGAATLTVAGNSSPIIREGDEFSIPVSRGGNANEADWHSLNVTATLAEAGRVVNGTAMDVTTQRQGKVWFPASPENLQYDGDGNLKEDGRWSYTWSAENRLIRIETKADIAASTGMPRIRLDMAYDAMGRRIRKATFTPEENGTGPDSVWKLKSDLRFLYEGMTWNLIAELEMVATGGGSSPRLVRSYAWGTDLSGSVTGAGGLGGLVFVQDVTNTVQAPCYDGNGNISVYVDVQSGILSSKHDYDAFGRLVWSELEGLSGRPTAASPFGFSTKYTDSETEYVYYGYRYYSPAQGRWLSRDPIEEKGGINLYGMVGNDPLNKWDYLGMSWTEQDENRNHPNPSNRPFNSAPDHLWEEWKRRLNESISKLEKTLTDLCPKGAVSNGKALAKSQCCGPAKCREQAKRIAAEMKKAAEVVGNSQQANGHAPAEGWAGNYVAHRGGPNHGQTASDADNGFGLKCTGWSDLMMQAFDRAVLTSAGNGSLCFGAATLSKSSWYKLGLDYHAWVVLYGPTDQKKTINNFSFAIDPWQSGGADFFPRRTYTPTKLEYVQWND